MVEIIGQGTVTLHWQPDALTFSDEQLEQVETLWTQRPETVFNGSLLVHRQTFIYNNHIRLICTFTEYKFYFAQRRGLDLGLNPVGVSGLIVVDGQVAFARRSPTVTVYPGMFELIPSGTIDKVVALKNGTVDFAAKLRQEFFEEVGLAESHVLDVQSFAVVRDPHDSAYDVVCMLKVNLTPDILLDSLQHSEEYTDPVLVPVSQLDEWIKKYQNEIIPTSQVMVSLWQKGIAL